MGYRDIKGFQWEAIKAAACELKDVLISAATFSGKSMIFTLLGLTVFIISPSIELIKDQMMAVTSVLRVKLKDELCAQFAKIEALGSINPNSEASEKKAANGHFRFGELCHSLHCY